MRRATDGYYTPEWATRELLARRPEIANGGQIVVEPCVGCGAIARVLAERQAMVISNDISPAIKALAHGDAQSAATWKEIEDYADTHAEDDLGRLVGSPARITPIDWTVTNPPFSGAFEILKHAYARSRMGVAFFLRLSFLEPTEDRGPWLAHHPPDELIVLPRISFTGDGSTDTVTCAWMIWHKHDTRPHVIEIVPKPVRIDTRQGALL